MEKKERRAAWSLRVVWGFIAPRIFFMVSPSYFNSENEILWQPSQWPFHHPKPVSWGVIAILLKPKVRPGEDDAIYACPSSALLSKIQRGSGEHSSTLLVSPTACTWCRLPLAPAACHWTRLLVSLVACHCTRLFSAFSSCLSIYFLPSSVLLYTSLGRMFFISFPMSISFLYRQLLLSPLLSVVLCFT